MTTRGLGSILEVKKKVGNIRGWENGKTDGYKLEKREEEGKLGGRRGETRANNTTRLRQISGDTTH